MPTFDFECKECGHVFEHTRPFGSKEHPACPACKSKRTEKLLTPPTVHFKGSGFYKTDASRAPAPKKKAESKKEEPKSEPKEAPKNQTPPSKTQEKNS